MIMLSDTVSPTLPTHIAFLPGFPEWTYYTDGHHSYISVCPFSLVSRLWPFPLSSDVPSFVTQHSDRSSPVLSGKELISWPYSQEIPGSYFRFIPCPQCAILWVCEDALHVMQMSFS